MCLLYPISLFGQNNSAIVGSVGGTINASMYGGATYSVPLEIPRGVGNMQPEIGIVYNSQGGNGLLGYGWNLSGISSITRTGSTLFHDGKTTTADFSGDDRFMLDGQRLVFVGTSGNTEEYKTEQDEFSKIIFYKENGYYSKCDVWLENGNVIKYGYTNNSKLMAGDGNNVIKWMVGSISDRNGNTISYTYETPSANGDIYISQIAYTSNIQANLTPEFVISFTYSNNRFDSYHYYIAGNKVTSTKILTGITISKAGNTIETYSFTYDGNSNRMYNLLKQISLSKGNYSLNPTVIVWNTDDNDVYNNTLSSQEISTAILNDFTFVGDVNGDGYTDLITVPYKPNGGYNGNVTVKVFLNDMTGDFSSTPDATITAPSSLEWIHVFDINNDGFDDIVLQTFVETVNGNNTTYTSGFVVWESSGSSFTNAYNTTINGEVLAKVGDFIGEGHNGLLVFSIQGWGDSSNTYLLDGYPSILHYTGTYSLNAFNTYLYNCGLVLTDDFTGDGKTEVIVFDTEDKATFSFGIQNNSYVMTSVVEDFDCSEYTSFFNGDFNNDGKADIMFNDVWTNYKYVMLSTGTGFTDPIQVTNGELTNIVFPQMDLYKCSLARVSSNSQYGINFPDIDGDGKTDIIYYNGNKKPTFFRDFVVSEGTTTTGSFRTVFQANSEDIVFKNQYFTMGNFIGIDHVSFIAIDPQDINTSSDDITNIYAFPSSNEVFTVNSITDGYGNNTEIEYAYLMPGNGTFYHYVNRPYSYDFKPYPVPILAMKSYVTHIGNNNYKTGFEYTNLLGHRTGRGLIGFEEVKRITSINNNVVGIEKGSFETSTMGINAVALPACDSVFICDNGNTVLSETNEYVFDDVKCSRNLTADGKRLIVRPAMVSQKTKHFNPDQAGGLLSVEIVNYNYNYNNSRTYSNTYHCTAITSGVNGSDCASPANCEFQSNTNISFKTNNYTNWIINRKSEETVTTEKTGKPAVTRKTKYEYSTSSPFLITRCTKIPSISLTDPLTIRTDYVYDACGNVTGETKSAPYGIQGEQSLTTQYSYINQRLLGGKTVDPNGLSYQEQYYYDVYDRMTQSIGSDNLTTTYSYGNTFGTNVVKTAPDNVVTTETTGWSAGVNNAPSNSSYYKTTATTGRPAATIFFDAAGNAVRTLTESYQQNPVVVDVVYNEKQLPTQKSNPYFIGDTPLWTVYQYDMFGRPTSATSPDGMVTNNAYDGFTTVTTTAVNNASRTTEKTTNPMGWLISSIDAANVAVTYDYYSDGKLASSSTSGGNVTVEIEYDNAGNRSMLQDHDYGTTTYVYDAYGRLIEQETPKGDVFSYEYDKLSRPTRKQDISESTTTLYQYNENTNKGTLASITHNGQLLEYFYDNYNRTTTIRETRDSIYTTSLEYDQYSRLRSRQYPIGFKVYYEYFPNGTRKSVTDASGNILWRTDAMNARGQLLQSTNGSNIVTTNTYDAATNKLLRSVTNNNIQKFVYTYDGWGNLSSRVDSIVCRKTEYFSYDNLDRLTGIYFDTISSAMTYDLYGRMNSKQKDGGTVFTSPRFGSYKLHAMKSAIAPADVFPEKQFIDYTSFDKVKTLSQDTKIAAFTYGYDNQRTRMTITDTITGVTKTKSYAGSCEFVDNGGTYTTYTYLDGPYGTFAMVVKTAGNESIKYIFKDHLGSWTTITDSLGNIDERRSFDAWGNQRDASTWTGVPARPSRYDRGFTGHEHLYNFGLINMNGRMYDPLTSSFLSPDNYVQNPTSQQSFNRYAYCMYNPLKYVDPTGERCVGMDMTLYYERMAREYVHQQWYSVYDMAMESNRLTAVLSSCLFSHGEETNGSGNHGTPGGDGNNQHGPSWQNDGDGNPTNTTNSSSGGKPGSSEDNPITEGNLFGIFYDHYMYGGKEPLYVSVSILCLDELPYSAFTEGENGNLSINLFSFTSIYPNIETAISLGKISLLLQENGMYKIDDDRYDFNFEWKSRWDLGVFNGRNLATGAAGIIHGNFYNIPIRITPALFWGGPFDIHFVGEININKP